MKHIYLIVYLTVLCTIFLGCSNKKNENLENYLASYDGVVGKQLKYNPSSFINFNKHYNYNKIYPNSILMIVNTECTSCIEKFKAWQEYKKQGNFNNLDIVFVAQGKVTEYFDYNVNKINNFDFKIYVDTTSSFIDSNGILLHSNSTFLLDRNNQIVMIGDPISNSIIKDFYAQKIEEISK